MNFYANSRNSLITTCVKSKNGDMSEHHRLIIAAVTLTHLHHLDTDEDHSGIMRGGGTRMEMRGKVKMRTCQKKTKRLVRTDSKLRRSEGNAKKF